MGTRALRSPRLYFLLLATAAGACAAGGVRYAEHPAAAARVPPDDARLTFFRLADTAQYSLRAARVVVDGVAMAPLHPGGFLVLESKPGTHTVVADMWDAPGDCTISLEVAPGADVYLEVAPRSAQVAAATPGTLVPGAEVVGLAVMIGGMAAESSGKECGGAFAVTPVDPAAARETLAGLRESG